MLYKTKSGSNKKIKSAFVILGFLLIFIAVFAVAGDEELQGESAAKYEGEVGTTVGIIGSDEKISSLNFVKNAQIRDALHFLSAKYKRNIIPSSKVEGLITVTSLYDVTFVQVLEAILGENYIWEQKGSIIEVYPKGDESRMTFRVFSLNYITATEAARLVGPILSELGKIESTTAAETGVPVDEAIASYTGGGDTMSLQDTIVVFDFAENIARAEKVIKAIDIRPKQVLVETTILDATLNEDMDFGIDWSTLGDTITAVGDISRNVDSHIGFAGTSKVALTGGVTIGVAIGNIASFIRAVEEVTDVTILANPKILAVNKQLGQVYIGTLKGYNSLTNVAEGGATTSQVAFLETGTKLSFRPYIGKNGYIRMDIHSKDSSGTVDETTGLPTETSAELVTNIMVKDGQTIVIGGMFRDKITTKRTQIPLLGDLPLIGGLFRGTSDATERHEVIVLLTPHIVDEPSQTDGAARAEDASRARDGAKNAFQVFSRSRLAEESYIKAAQYYLDGDKAGSLQQLDLALELRPTYLEAIRLKEKIITETNPDDAAAIERKMRQIVERNDTKKWKRR